MGEKQTVQIADRLNDGESIKNITDIRGTCYAVRVTETPYVGVECPSFENVVSSKRNMLFLAEFNRMNKTTFVVKL